MPRNRRRKKSSRAPEKIIGSSNITYETTENHDGPGRAPATVGFGNAIFPGKFSFTLRYPHNARAGEGRMMTSTWAAAYAAKTFLEYVIGDEEPDWTSLNRCVTSRGVEISCSMPEDKKEENDLEIALNYKRTKAERAFILPEKDRKTVDLMLRPYPDVEKQSTGKAKIDRAASSRPDGKYITVAEICEELGLEPREGRAALRKAKFEKPDWGWSFPVGSDDYRKAKSTIRKGTK